MALIIFTDYGRVNNYKLAFRQSSGFDDGGQKNIYAPGC